MFSLITKFDVVDHISYFTHILTVPTLRQIIDKISREGPEIEVEIQPKDYLELLADLLRRLGVVEKYKEAVSRIEMDFDNPRLYTIARNIAEGLCPYACDGVCILHWAMIKLRASSLSMQTDLEKKIQYVVRKLVAEKLGSDSLRRLVLQKPDVEEYAASLVRHYEELLSSLKSMFDYGRGYTAIIRLGKQRYRVRIMCINSDVDVHVYHDLDRDVIIVHVIKPESRAVFCSLSEYLRDAVLLRDLLLPHLTS